MVNRIPVRAAFASSLTLVALAVGGCAEKDAPPAGPTTCQAAAFTTSSERVVFDPWHDRLVYTLEAEGGPFEQLQIRSYAGQPKALQGPGRYDLNGSNFKDCDLCLLAFSDCTDNGCDKVFFADSGALLVSDFGAVGENLAAQLHDVIFKEVTIDDETWESVLVPGGTAFCAHGISFGLPIEEKTPSPTCVDGGSGALLGDNIANYSLPNCNGDLVPLHSFCGTTQSVRLMLVAGWCSACEALVPEAEAHRIENAGRGQETLYILGEDDNFAEPSLAFCLEYAARHEIAPERMLVDFGNEWGSWETTFTNVYPYIGNTIGLPWNAVLDGTNMQYVYNDEVGPGTLTQTMGQLLNR